jgi:hypothetical protein
MTEVADHVFAEVKAGGGLWRAVEREYAQQ